MTCLLTLSSHHSAPLVTHAFRCILTNCSFRLADLSRSSFVAANCNACDFTDRFRAPSPLNYTHAPLQTYNRKPKAVPNVTSPPPFSPSNIRNADFTACLLAGVVMRGVQGGGAVFQDALMTGVQADGAVFDDAPRFVRNWVQGLWFLRFGLRGCGLGFQVFLLECRFIV